MCLVYREKGRAARLKRLDFVQSGCTAFSDATKRKAKRRTRHMEMIVEARA